MKVYGIPKCDTVKKALTWLKANKIQYEFFDLKNGIDQKKINHWINKAGLEVVMNKKSTTWRSLSVEDQNKTNSIKQALKIISENTSIIKRPVIEYQDELLIGFNEAQYIKSFKR